MRKSSDGYLDLMRDATEEYKAQLKKVSLDFNAKYFDKLIHKVDETQTSAPKDLVGFD